MATYFHRPRKALISASVLTLKLKLKFALKSSGQQSLIFKNLSINSKDDDAYDSFNFNVECEVDVEVLSLVVSISSLKIH